MIRSKRRLTFRELSEDDIRDDERPEKWANGFLLHHDNAPCHSSLLIREFLAEKNVPVCPHPPYSPDLAPCDFWLFPKIKSVLKGKHFDTIADIERATTEQLKAFQKMPSRNASSHGVNVGISALLAKESTLKEIKSDSIMAIHIKDSDDLKTRLGEAGGKLVIIDFMATWCSHCKIIGTKLEDLAKEMADSIVVLKVDVDECEDLASEYNVNSLPTFVFIKNSQKLEEFSGAKVDKLQNTILKLK